MPFSEQTKVRIIALSAEGHKPPTIARLLDREGQRVSRRGVDKFLQRYQETRSLGRRGGSGRPAKQDGEMRAVIEARMQEDDETTVRELHRSLADRGCDASASTVLR